MPTEIAESRPIVESIAKNGVSAKKMHVRIIEGERWGSSGFYSKEVLERDGGTAFPAGTQMYLDHPSESEGWERPERSVRDLAGITKTAAVYEKDGLYADIEVYPHVAEVIAGMAEDIGLSIRAAATVESGEAQGRKGPIISQIHEGLSVDFVTRAGAGGKVVQILESARQRDKTEEVTEVVEVTETETSVVKEATTDDRRLQLRDALNEAYEVRDGDDRVYVWTMDWDESRGLVWFELDSTTDEAASGTYQQSFTVSDDDLSVSLTGERIEVRRVTTYRPVGDTSEATSVPAVPVEDTPTPTKESSTMADVTVSESKLRDLEESSRKVDVLESQVKDLQGKEREALVEGAKETARANKAEAKLIVTQLMHEAGIKGAALSESLATNPPLEEDGKLDEKRLSESVKTALGEVSASIDESRGGVRGFGEGANTPTVTSEAVDAKVAGVFGRKVSA